VTFTCPGNNTSPLALLLGLEAVLVASTASVPELCARVGLPVVVPQDDVVPAGALAQGDTAPGIHGGRH